MIKFLLPGSGPAIKEGKGVHKLVRLANNDAGV